MNSRTVGVLRVTFKVNSVDVRGAPSLAIVPALMGGGARVRVVGLRDRREGEAFPPGVTWPDAHYATAAGSEALRLRRSLTT